MACSRTAARPAPSFLVGLANYRVLKCVMLLCVRYDIVSEKKKMTRYRKLDVENAVSMLADELGIALKLTAHSPGDRYGTRYRVHLAGDTEHSLGKRVFAECGAKLTTERLWTAIDMLRLYKKQQTAAAQAVATLPDMEA